MEAPTINEVSILASISSPYIVRYMDSFIENGSLYLVMEYCEKGDISSFLTSQMGVPLNENKIWRIALEILSGLATLHKGGIIHRDIKARNIFLTRGYHIKIGDFGVRTRFGLPYRSPHARAPRRSGKTSRSAPSSTPLQKSARASSSTQRLTCGASGA